MRPGFFILAAVLCPRPDAVAQADGLLAQALAETARVAATSWCLAPDYVTRETLNQKALTLPKRRFRAGAGAIQPPKPEFSHREIVSYYAPSYFRTSSAAPHEFRALLNELEKTSLAVAATDFGQLILLFTKANQGKYNSKMRGAALAGADRAIIVDFGQSAGAEAFRVAQPGKEVREPLTGSR